MMPVHNKPAECNMWPDSKTGSIPGSTIGNILDSMIDCSRLLDSTADHSKRADCSRRAVNNTLPDSTTGNMADNMTGSTPDNTPGSMPGSMPGNNPGSKIGNTPDSTADCNMQPDNRTGNNPGNMPGSTADCNMWPGNILGSILDNMPDNILDSMADCSSVSCQSM